MIILLFIKIINEHEEIKKILDKIKKIRKNKIISNITINLD
jgi:PII-like signaling protein